MFSNEYCTSLILVQSQADLRGGGDSAGSLLLIVQTEVHPLIFQKQRIWMCVDTQAQLFFCFDVCDPLLKFPGSGSASGF